MFNVPVKPINQVINIIDKDGNLDLKELTNLIAYLKQDIKK